MKRREREQRLIISPEERMHRDLVYINNPVLVGGLALAPVIGAATTLRNALMFAIAVFILLVPTRFIGNLLVGYVPQRLRAMVYAIIAAFFYIPAILLLIQLFGTRVATLGVYLPMLVVDSIIISRAEIPQRERISESLRNGLLTAIGFALAVIVTGALRELLGEGRLLGRQLLSEGVFPIASTAAGGFIVVAILAALLQFFVSTTKRRVFREVHENE